jgi:hypothetical protein
MKKFLLLLLFLPLCGFSSPVFETFSINQIPPAASPAVEYYGDRIVSWWSPAICYTATFTFNSPSNATYVLEHNYGVLPAQQVSGGWTGMNWIQLGVPINATAGENTLTISVPPWDTQFFRLRTL